MTMFPTTDLITFIYTKDNNRAFKFYEEIMGFKMVMEQSDCRVYKVAGHGFVGVCGRSGAPIQPKDHEDRNVMLSLITNNLEEWDRHLKAKGVAYEDEFRHYDKYNLMRILVRDPDDYLIEILTFDDPDALKTKS